MNDLISKSDLIRSIDVCDDIQQITVKISNATCIDVVPRHLVKDRLTGLKTYNGKEELTPCGLCYKNNNCNKNPSECWELDVYEKLKSYEDDYLGGNND